MKVGGKKKLLNWVSDALVSNHPDQLIEAWVRNHPGALQSEAILCWGKAAISTWERLSRHGRRASIPALMIAPAGGSAGAPAGGALPRESSGARFCFGEHPIPDRGSLRAGGELLEFLASLRRLDIRRLRVFLSGGASALAWVPPAGCELRTLQERLNRLYQAGLDIRAMNRERAKLCALKAGGAARWLERLSPGVQVRVEVISDVLPFEPAVVGSGPFWNGRVPHRVLADNRSLLKAIETSAKREGIQILVNRPGWLAPTERWCEEICSQIRRHADHPSRELLFLYGGEPISAVRRPGIGGRLSHLGAMLAWNLRDFSGERHEILGLASDGLDGRSESGGFLLGAESARKLQKRVATASGRRRWIAAMKEFNSASRDGLGGIGALIPSQPTGTNLQDVVALRIR